MLQSNQTTSMSGEHLHTKCVLLHMGPMLNIDFDFDSSNSNAYI